MPVAQDGDAVRHLEDLGQAVADQNDGHALVPQAANDAKEFVCFLRRERGRRFVHEQHAGIE